MPNPAPRHLRVRTNRLPLRDPLARSICIDARHADRDIERDCKQPIRRIALKRCGGRDREIGRQANPVPHRDPRRRAMKACREAGDE
nr:hypothetical protein [Burkholderia sp. A2]